jgi:hypothetical protein
MTGTPLGAVWSDDGETATILSGQIRARFVRHSFWNRFNFTEKSYIPKEGLRSCAWRGATKSRERAMATEQKRIELKV